MLRRVAILLVLVLGCLVAPASSLAYPWPLRPFYAQHPIRGFFNDPRIRYGETSFHSGVDITAQDLTRVYAVAPGKVSARGQSVTVRAGSRTWGYWHIIPAVLTGQRVKRHGLVGYIAPGWKHVHLSETIGGVYVNPLRYGGLEPYFDDTIPTIMGVTFSANGPLLDAQRLSGTFDLIVDVYDTTPFPLPPAPWKATRVAPAKIRWRVVQGPSVILPWGTSIDFRTALHPREFWENVYAPGTRQNKPNSPGHYLLYVANDWDSRGIPNGSYELQVEALDTQDNRASVAVALTIAN